MKTDDLLVLLEIARCGSFLRAGHALGLDHSTVSRRIGALERELKEPLVDRGVQGCTLTPLGERLLSSCELVEAAATEVRKLTEASSSEQGGLHGLVRVSTTEAFGAYVVTPALAAVHRSNPGLQMEIVTQNRVGPYGTGSDIEIGIGDPVRSRPGAILLTQYRLGLYASNEYLQARGEPRSVADLAEHSLIYYVEGLLRIEDLDVLGRFTSSTHAAFASTSAHAQLFATRAGAGIGLLPAFMADDEPGIRRVLFDDVVVTAEFSACLAPSRTRRPAAMHVMRAIHSAVQGRRHELMPT